MMSPFALVANFRVAAPLAVLATITLTTVPRLYNDTPTFTLDTVQCPVVEEAIGKWTADPGMPGCLFEFYSEAPGFKIHDAVFITRQIQGHIPLHSELHRVHGECAECGSFEAGPTSGDAVTCPRCGRSANFAVAERPGVAQ